LRKRKDKKSFSLLCNKEAFSLPKVLIVKFCFSTVAIVSFPFSSCSVGFLFSKVLTNLFIQGKKN
jgi:hypothetical protein